MSDSAANPAPGFAKHPGYEVKLEPVAQMMTVELAGREIARSNNAVLLTETKHRPVWYMPLADVDAQFITATDTQTYCPFKGHASYWSVSV